MPHAHTGSLGLTHTHTHTHTGTYRPAGAAAPQSGAWGRSAATRMGPKCRQHGYAQPTAQAGGFTPAQPRSADTTRSSRVSTPAFRSQSGAAPNGSDRRRVAPGAAFDTGVGGDDVCAGPTCVPAPTGCSPPVDRARTRRTTDDDTPGPTGPGCGHPTTGRACMGEWRDGTGSTGAGVNKTPLLRVAALSVPPLWSHPHHPEGEAAAVAVEPPQALGADHAVLRLDPGRARSRRGTQQPSGRVARGMGYHRRGDRRLLPRVVRCADLPTRGSGYPVHRTDADSPPETPPGLGMRRGRADSPACFGHDIPDRNPSIHRLLGWAGRRLVCPMVDDPHRPAAVPNPTERLATDAGDEPADRWGRAVCNRQSGETDPRAPGHLRQLRSAPTYPSSHFGSPRGIPSFTTVVLRLLA